MNKEIYEYEKARSTDDVLDILMSNINVLRNRALVDNDIGKSTLYLSDPNDFRRNHRSYVANVLQEGTRSLQFGISKDRVAQAIGHAVGAYILDKDFRQSMKATAMEPLYEHLSERMENAKEGTIAHRLYSRYKRKMDEKVDASLLPLDNESIAMRTITLQQEIYNIMTNNNIPKDAKDEAMSQYEQALINIDNHIDTLELDKQEYMKHYNMMVYSLVTDDPSKERIFAPLMMDEYTRGGFEIRGNGTSLWYGEYQSTDTKELLTKPFAMRTFRNISEDRTAMFQEYGDLLVDKYRNGRDVNILAYEQTLLEDGMSGFTMYEYATRVAEHLKIDIDTSHMTAYFTDEELAKYEEAMAREQAPETEFKTTDEPTVDDVKTEDVAVEKEDTPLVDPLVVDDISEEAVLDTNDVLVDVSKDECLTNPTINEKSDFLNKLVNEKRPGEYVQLLQAREAQLINDGYSKQEAKRENHIADIARRMVELDQTGAVSSNGIEFKEKVIDYSEAIPRIVKITPKILTIRDKLIEHGIYSSECFDYIEGSQYDTGKKITNIAKMFRVTPERMQLEQDVKKAEALLIKSNPSNEGIEL